MEAEQEQERSPATWGLAALWVLIFVAMCLDQGKIQAIPGHVLSGGISPLTASRFGDVTPQSLVDGQCWRALTATFIHYSWLHLGFNLVMFLTLGRLMEPWYGWGGFLGVYCVIGFFGNVVAMWAKTTLGGFPMHSHSGGGSGVLCGLIALLAVVGWRSKTRFGDYVKGQMVGLLVFIAVMGLVVPNVGNYEHAGGAVVGAGLGFVHRRLIRLTERRLGRVIGIVCLLLLLACAGLQAASGVDPETRSRQARVIQARLQIRQEAVRGLQIVGALFSSVATEDAKNPGTRAVFAGSFIDPIQRRIAIQRFRAELQKPLARAAVRAAMLRQLEGLSAGQSSWLPDDDQRAWKTVEDLVRIASRRRPSPGEIARFRRSVETIMTDLIQAQAQDDRSLKALQPAPAPPEDPPRPRFGQ